MRINKYENFKVWYSKKGYPLIWIDGKEVKLHVYIWEKANGNKPLGHDVHHKDNDKGNFLLDNLELLTFSEHRRIHCGWIRENGRWVAKPCNACNQVLPLSEFYYVKTRKIESALCKTCHNEAIKKRNNSPLMRQKLKIYKKKYYQEHYGRQAQNHS